MESFERKHLHMRVFRKTKIFKDQNKPEFYFISAVMKTNVNMFLYEKTQCHFG